MTTTWLNAQVEDSLALLERYLDSLPPTAPSSPLHAYVHRGLKDAALGGKHLRARLVHIAAWKKSSTRLKTPWPFIFLAD